MFVMHLSPHTQQHRQLSFFIVFFHSRREKICCQKQFHLYFASLALLKTKRELLAKRFMKSFSGAHTNTVVWTGTSPATKACIVCEIKYKNYLLLETDIIKGSVFVRPRPSTATFLVSQLLSSQHIKLFLALLLISRLPPLCVHCSHCCLYGFQWVLFNIFYFIYGRCSRCFLLLFSVCSSLLAQHFTSHTFHIFFARLFLCLLFLTTVAHHSAFLPVLYIRSSESGSLICLHFYEIAFNFMVLEMGADELLLRSFISAHNVLGAKRKHNIFPL